MVPDRTSRTASDPMASRLLKMTAMTAVTFVPQTEQSQTTDGFRCLILEDDQSVAEVLAQAVKTAGGEPAIAPTVERATALMAEQDFDVCVIDYVLPDGKGSAFFSSLRERGVLTPCIMLTGAPEINIAEIGRASCRERV